jgi:hypothetical protein
LSELSDDGLFILDFDSFLAYFDHVHIAHVNKEWTFNYISLTTDDSEIKEFTFTNPSA